MASEIDTITANISMKNDSLYSLIQASYATHVIYLLTKNSVFDSLLAKHQTVEELAEVNQFNKSLLEDLLLFAVSMRLLKHEGGRYAVAKKGLLLTKKVNSWERSYLLVWGTQLNPAMSQFDKALTDGANAFKLAHGDLIWDFYEQNAKENEVFVDFMHGVTSQSQIPVILNEIYIGNANSVVDVGGGRGGLIQGLLTKYPDLNAIIFDQPSNRDRALDNIAKMGTGKRCKFVSGNIFGEIPEGQDLYLIKHVLHDWDDQHAGQILAAISKAMRPDSELIIIEGVLDRPFEKDFVGPEFIHTRNIEQRAWTNGRVRKRNDFEQLGKIAGLKIVLINHSKIADMSYISCRKVNFHLVNN